MDGCHRLAPQFKLELLLLTLRWVVTTPPFDNRPVLRVESWEDLLDESGAFPSGILIIQISPLDEPSNDWYLYITLNSGNELSVQYFLWLQEDCVILMKKRQVGVGYGSWAQMPLQLADMKSWVKFAVVW